MKKQIVGSIVASTVVFSVLFSGCGSSSSSTPTDSTPGTETPDTQTPDVNTAMIQIETENGTRESIDPATGGTVVVSRNSDGTQDVATVVHAELNDCANETTDSDGDGVVCGPKKGVTYAFQSAFGALGPVDDNKSTPDGGLLLFDALTYYNGAQYNTPVEGNTSENRIQEVYIPSNYITLTDELKNASVDTQYDAMREYLADVCNMQCLSAEDEHNPYFTDDKTEGTFVATYVMWFTRGTGEDTLAQEFAGGDYSDLEYLAVEFLLKVERVDGDSSKLRFTVPDDSDVIFRAKKHDEGAVMVSTSNDVINSVLHESQDYVHPDFTINMAKYFDKLIEKGDSLGVSDYAKEILVENAQNPWPVKIYGTLHEQNDDGTYDRSFVRNPGVFNASWFNLDSGSEYADAYKADSVTADRPMQAIKFNIVYPGGDYNKL